MKAAIIREYGGIEKVEVGQMPDPAPGPGEVLIEARCAALNHLDIWVTRGSRGGVLSEPKVIGSDASGVIADVGRGVKGFSVGQEVVVNPGLCCETCEFCRRGEQSECAEFGIIGLSRPGTFAQKVAIPARNAAPKPERLSFEQAAALPLAYLTAWHMLMTRAAMKPGETVLIHGIGGGVALAALQIASACSAQIIVTSSSQDKLSRALKLGASQIINYGTTKDVAAAVRDYTKGRGVDIAVDTVGAATWPLDIACVRRGGRVVICGVTTGAEAATDLRAVYWNHLSLLGSTLGSDEDFRLLLAAANAGRLEPVVDSVWPLSQVRDAMGRMEKGEQFGKIVLDVRSIAD